jgi:hypothetical protein
MSSHIRQTFGAHMIMYWFMTRMLLLSHDDDDDDILYGIDVLHNTVFNIVLEYMMINYAGEER